MAPATREVPRWALALPLIVVIAAVATGAALVIYSRSARTVTVTGGIAAVGRPAPLFSTWDLNGNKVSLGDLRGHPVLLTFWATWCTACREELPAVQQLRDGNQSGGLRVLAVNYRETDIGSMRTYLAGLHVDLVAVIDPDAAIASAYGVDIGLPVVVLLDRSATVSQILIGAVPSATLEAAVARVVGGGTSP
ncbi:MAG: cytochrome c biosis protein CcmG, thiol:disulfide interchange protein DsbE [Chloroflexota bacterium]|nr:cytochrome c biosis protein CcmG, thiol:disulfide interchange protein DsbE [Chloroflexota bacterium]